MKIKKLVLAAATAVMVAGMAMTAYASDISSEYKSWHYDTFGYYPNGGLSYWVSDPAFYKYLSDYGVSDSTGYYYYENDGYYYFDGSGTYAFYDYNSDSSSSSSSGTYYYDYSDSTKYYAEVTDAYWSGSTAKWTVDGKASKYQVRLYRDDSKIGTYNAKSKSYSLSSEMGRAGYYYFEVRAYNSTSGWSDWESSEDKYFSGSSSSSSSSGSITAPVGSTAGPGGSTTGAQWRQATDGTGRWWYKHADGTYTKNNWEKIGDKWYYFDETGWMKTGWIAWNNATYYLGTDGAMVTGYQTIGGVGHNFSPDGAMLY